MHQYPGSWGDPEHIQKAWYWPIFQDADKMQDHGHGARNAAVQHGQPRVPGAPPAPAGLLGTGMYHRWLLFPFKDPVGTFISDSVLLMLERPTN